MLPESELTQCAEVATQPFGDPEADERRVIVNALDHGFCVIEVRFDAEGRPCDYVFLEVNGAFERLTGLHDAVGRSMRSLTPDHEQHWFDIYGEIARTGEPKRFVAEAAALARWYQVHAFRLGEPGQNRVGILFDDITEHKRKEEHYALLNREINHRARNMLTLLGALIRLTGGEDVEAYKDALLGRLNALARSQQVLSEGGSDFADYSELIASEMAPYLADDMARVQYRGPEVPLNKPTMQCLAMALHELATNAVKYGALSVPDGAVSIAWSWEGDTLRTRWTERGGPCVSPPTRQGVGSSVIARCIRDQLRGTVAFDWRSEGLRCELAVPVKRAAPSAH